jgi:hypothetical protein
VETPEIIIEKSFNEIEIEISNNPNKLFNTVSGSQQYKMKLIKFYS